jgi:hypothetical protein
MPGHPGGRLFYPFCVERDRTRHGNGESLKPVEVLRNNSNFDGSGSTLYNARAERLDTDSNRSSLDDSNGVLSDGAKLANFRLYDHRGSMPNGRNSGGKPKGVPNMEQISNFLAIASGYVIAFAVGAWIGRPLLALVTERIFKK